MSLAANGELVPVGGGDSIPLIRELLTVGRRESCDICLRLPNVSGRHCELNFRDGFWSIRDLGSTNGIKVNGRRVDKKVLQPGDTITIAKRNYTIEYIAPSGRRPVEEEDDIMGKSLLEKAGLLHPERDNRPRLSGKREIDAARFLLDGGEPEE
jgi:adenylate cyclase